MSLPDHLLDDEWTYWDDEPRPVCLRCNGRHSSPTAPYCGPCAKVIDEQVRIGFNPYQDSPFARNSSGTDFTPERAHNRKEDEMRRNEALPSNYLGKDDFPKPVLCRVHDVDVEEIKTDRGEERKPVLYIRDPSSPVDVNRGIILNGTNWDALEEITGHEDSDDWKGTEIVVYVDPDVRFGNKKVGGLRVRAPKKQSAPDPEPQPEPDPAPEDSALPASDDIPF